MNNQTTIQAHSSRRAAVLLAALLALSTAATGPALAATNAIGAADGSFETDLSSTTATGDTALVPGLGTLEPTEGVQSLLMTTQPDFGSTPADADVSTLTFDDFTIGAEYATLRLDYNFLTNEPDPSLANDSFTVTLVLVTAGGEELLLSSDTFAQFQPSVWSGYALQTGFRTMIADVTAVANGTDLVGLELRIEDLGDGRRDSAVLVDNVRLVEPGAPRAVVASNFFQIAAGEIILFDGSGSSDDVGIVSYDWDFGNGFIANGPLIGNDAYTEDGFYQGTLTVTDADGFTDTATFNVAVGDGNSAPTIVSTPNPTASEGVPYQYQVVVDDAEVQFGDVISYALTAAPAGMTIDPASGLITWTPPAGLAEVTNVSVEATDSLGLSGTQSFGIARGPEVYVATVGDNGRIYTARSVGDGRFEEFRFEGDIATSNTTRGVVIADFTGNDRFDLITGYPDGSRLDLFLYEREGGLLRTPTYLGRFDTANPSYLMDMAAEDFDNDADMDFVLDTNSARAWYFENTGPLVTEAESFFASDFETGNEGWGGQQARTTLARDDTTSSSGTWSMRVSATGTPTTLSIDINPSSWFLARGSTVRFDYRIPPGVPAGLLFQVTGRDWIWLGGAPAGDPGAFTVAPGAVTLIDDDTWRSVEIDVYELIREVWPEAYQISEFQFWTNNNAAAGQQFWFDDFRITRPRMVSGFSASLLPDTGGNGRGMDAEDANNDGNMDFVRARSGGQLFLYTGDGTGNFTTSQFGATSDPYGLVLADFDNDGNADAIAISNGSGDPYFYAGNGDGTFQAGVLVPSMDVNNYASYGTYDFDNDGNMDVVVSTYTSRLLWYYPGNGDGTFGARTLIGSTTSPAVNILSVAAPAGRRTGQPFASATQDLLIIDEGGTVSFDASASYDDGSIVSYDWDFGDGNPGSGVAVSNTFASEGNYNVLLTVTDDEGYRDRLSLSVTVNGELPVAAAGGPYALGEAQALRGVWPGTLDGTASSDADTSIARYEWDFDAGDGLGVDATGPYARPNYPAPGSYTVTLTVFDEVGQSATTTTTMVVSAGDVPVPSLAGPAALGETEASLGRWTGWFDIAPTTDDFGIASYTIDWGDGNTESLSPLADDFRDGNYTIDPVWNVNGGTWGVSDGVLQQTALGAAWRWLQDRNRVYRDFQLEVDFQAVAGAPDGYMGIAFRNANTAGSTNTFLMYARNSWDFWRFYDWQTGTALVDGGTGWDPGIWYHLRLVVIGDTMRLYVTPEGGVETLQIEFTSAAHPTGGIGLLANDQSVRYDNVKVTPLDTQWTLNNVGLGDFAKTYDAADTYPIQLTVSDHAGQSVVALQDTVVGGAAAPVADAGGPYTLDETDALGGHWNLIVDASASTDDTNVERYTIDFGDGTSYTTGFADGSRGSYFATGTDLYGYDTADGDLRRIIATEAATEIEIIDLATNVVIASTTLNRLQAWDPPGSPPGNGIAYKVKATKPVVAYFTDFANHNTFVPSMDGDPVGKEFIFYLDINGGFYVYAYEDAVVQFFNNAGTLVATRNLRAGSYWTASATVTARDYRVVSSGRISMQTTGNNGFTTVPSDNGDGAGRLFYFATRDGTTESIAAFAYDPADVEVFDLDTGESLYTASIAAGDMWYQTGVGTRRLRLESTADVEVWAGDTQGGTAITSLGDDISFAGGRAGTEFLLHTLNDGVVIFAPNNGTSIDIDSGGLTATLQRDEFLRLPPADFPGGTGVHRIVTSEPVIIQTLGQANGYNDLGSYLGGVAMRHQYLGTGTYTLTVTATDNAGQTDVATTTVDVVASDPPVPAIDAPAVADETFAMGGQWTVQFDASGSTDDVGIFSYDWDFGDGGTGTGVDPEHVYTAPGTYDVTLTVTDNAGQSVQTTQSIQVTFGDGPVADAGGPYVFGEDVASLGVWTALLDASGSSDDVAILDYLWTLPGAFSDDFAGTTIDPATWTASTGATQDEAITVVGAGGWTNRYLTSVETYERGFVYQAQLTTAPAGTQRSMWGLKNTSASTSFTAMPYAFYFNGASLQVYEDGSNRGTVGSVPLGVTYDIRITVNVGAGATYEFKRADESDWIVAYVSAHSTAAPLLLHGTVLNGAMTIDNVQLDDYLTGPNPAIEFDAPGIRTITLRVRDNALQESFDTTTITIEAGAPPVADAGGPYTVEVGSMNLFNGTASSDDVNVESYDWTFGDTTGGPDAPGAETANLPYVGRGATVEHFYRAVGTYPLTLTVTDNAGQTDTATTTVEVIVGSPPVAAIEAPTAAAAGGPPAYFDARATADDYGVVEYRWDFDEQVDRDGDGNFTNDIDAVGARPFHTFDSFTGTLGTETFDGTALDTDKWLAAGATQNDAVTVIGAGTWGNRYLFSNATYERGISFRGRITPVNTTGNQYAMIGLKTTSTSFSYTVMPHAIYFANDNILIYEQGANRGVFGTYTRGQAYEVRIDVKTAAGATYFFREVGAADWTQLYDSTNRSDRPLRIGITVNSGTFELDDFAVSGRDDPYLVTLTVEDGAGQTDTATIPVSVAQNLPPNVITVPWVARDPVVPHETYAGHTIRLKGIVRDADPVNYQWDFGDGTQSPVTAVTNPYDLSVAHTYPAAPAGTPFTAVLKVWDSVGQLGQDTYNVIIRPLTLNTEVNIAIDEGLWYLHQQQTRTTAEGYDTGYWTSNARASATASSIQAFEINGHTEDVDHAEDPYAETVMRGLRQLFRDLGTVDIATQTYGEPDTNGNGIGIQTGVNASGGQPIYQGGQVMDAIASSRSPLARTITGASGINRRSYFDILTDMSDQFVWGQTEQGSGGGWRYGWNSSIDNSAAQWGAIGMLASEDVFGIPVPVWAKERNRVWLDNAYSGTGWGYTSSGTSRAGTPSGLVQWTFSEGKTGDGQWRTAEKWMADNWTSQYIINPGNRPYYPYFALTKAMRLAEPRPVVNFASNGFDWFNDPLLGLARTLVDDQLASGQFPGTEWITAQLRSAWGVIILSQTLFVLPPVADAGRDRAWAVDEPLEFDASGSFHLDPFRSIARYEWDFEGDGIFDVSTSEPTVEYTYTSDDYPIPTLPRTFTVTLRVTDDQTPALTDTDTVNIIVAEPPHPPVAEAGGPYTCTLGVPCQLDGSGSFDIDPFDKIVRWEWELDNAFPFDFDEATGETPQVVFDTLGIFDLGLRVFDDGQFNDLDGDGEVDEDERLSDQHFVKVTVEENLPPVADANGPYIIDEGSSATLDASGSVDPNGDALVYEWDLDDDGVFDDAVGVTTSFLGLDDGSYPVAVRVTDSLLTDTASSTVTVNNVAPTVNAGPDFTIGEGAQAVFNGSFSDPGPQDTHTIVWDFGDGNGASATLTPNHSYDADGIYVVTLTVTDDDGGVGSDTLTVTVTDGVPNAVLTGDTNLIEGDLGSFDASGSTSPSDAITGFEWDFGFDGTFDASGATGPTATNLFPEDGTYTVAVRVTDSDGSTDIATLDVAVDNAPPVVDAGPDQLNVQVGNPIALAPADFTDLGVLDTHTASIDWGDTTVEAGVVDETDGSGTVSGDHVYASPGVYTVTVTVTDDDGGVGSDSLTVEIVATPNNPPVVDAGPDDTVTLPDLATLDGTVVDDGEPNGTLTTLWTQISGPGTVTFGDATAVDTTASFSAPGTYVLRLTADDSALTGFDEVAITVVAIPNSAPVVDAGPDDTVTLPDLATLDGTVVDDGEPNGTLTTLWTQISGPGTVTFGDATAVDTTASFSEAGTYVLRLTADDSALTGFDEVAITVVATPNSPPVVDAGPDDSVTLPALATLDGTVVDDGEPNGTLSTLWTQISGPGTVTFGDAAAVDTTASFSEAGTYVLRLTADDSALTGFDEVAITVVATPNSPPVVDAGPDDSVTLPDLATLDGTVVDDGEPNGTLSTLWTQISGPGTVTFGDAAAVDTTASFSAPGTYVLRLTADDSALTGFDEVAITVVATPNSPPVVDAGPDDSVTLPDLATLDGTVVDDGEPNGTLSTLWTQISGPGTVTFGDAAAVDTTASFSAPGTYVLRLTADDSALTGFDEVAITVEEAQVEPPEAPMNLVARPKSTKVQLVWTHNGSDSYNVYRSLVPGGPYTLIANTTSTYSTYLDEGLTDGVTYYYVVTSVLGGLESVNSVEVSGTPQARTRSR